MSALDNLKARLNYAGGAVQQDRMIADKLRSLKSAMKSSYSAAVIEHDGYEFTALINPNKLNLDVDDKVISIPFEDTCLNAGNEIRETKVDIGSVIRWVRNDTYWIVYTKYLQELAYFRGQMRRCEDIPLEINGKRFYYYLQGPTEAGIDWQKTKRVVYNELNYTSEMYISNTAETEDYFSRFSKLKLKIKKANGDIVTRPFEVQAVDRLTQPGLLVVYIKEDFEQEFTEEEAEAVETPIAAIRISGPAQVYPYDKVEFVIIGAEGGEWALSNNKARFVSKDSNSALVEIVTGRSGSVSLSYKYDGNEISQDITILSI